MPAKHGPIAGFLAGKAIAASGLREPFGGPEWPQKSGYEIRLEIYQSTKQAILRALDADPDLEGA